VVSTVLERETNQENLVCNSNKMHKSQSFFLFNLITALHVLGVTTTHPQEHKATPSTASGNHYTVIDRVKFTDKRVPID
jgi:hypothetical protein